MPGEDDPKPGFRWPVALAQPIPAPASEVWQVISTPGSLEDFHPHCVRNPVQVWRGAESRDEVHYLSGRRYERRFRRWIDGVGYDLEVGDPGGPWSFVSWRILPIDEGRCTLRITVFPHGLQNVPAAIRLLPHLLLIRPRLRSYLSSVLRGCEWYVTRREPVPKDQFGSHPWFSATRRGLTA